MNERVATVTPRPDPAAAAGGARTNGFRLMRYFVLTSLVAFSAVGLTLLFLQREEENFFAQVQVAQTEFFAQAQEEFARQQEAAARNNLLLVHEAGHVNLTRMFANALWDKYFLPLVVRTQQLPIDRCRAIAADSKRDAADSRTDAKRACFAEVGRQIKSMPGFAVLDAKAHQMMQRSTVFKIKVFDLRGLTVYSSEHAQIGEDKADNAGWQSAVSGKAASELTHRDRFSAFERVVENRDLISSYLPVLDGSSGKIVGVFEIYSDVTPFLEQIKVASAGIANLAAKNQARTERVAAENQFKVISNSDRFLLIVGGLLALLYLALLLLVRNGQRIIDTQARAQAQAVRREERWHREKMEALATMAANVAHEVGNPLATISMLAEDIAGRQTQGSGVADQARAIVEQTRRIANMTRQIADFAAARSETPEPVDINQMLRAICEFLSFDHRLRATRIEFCPCDRLPAPVVIPDHLNEALMNLLQACAVGETGNEVAAGQIRVETKALGDGILIRIVSAAISTGSAFAMNSGSADSRVEAARRRVISMDGRLSSSGNTVEVILPAGTQSVVAT